MSDTVEVDASRPFSREVEFSESEGLHSFFCPEAHLDSFKAFLVEEGISILKIEAGVESATKGGSDGLIFVGQNDTVSGLELAAKFNDSLR